MSGAERLNVLLRHLLTRFNSEETAANCCITRLENSMYELDIISITDDGIVTARMIPMEEHMYVDKEGRTIIEYGTEKNT